MIVLLKSILEKKTYPEAGMHIYELIKNAIQKEDIITIDMTNIISVPTLFLNTSFGAIIDEFGSEKLKKNIKLKNVSRLQAEKIKTYIYEYDDKKITRGKFEIKKTKSGEYQFNLKVGNGLIILTSENYLTKEECKEAIENLKVKIIEDKFEKIKTPNGNFYFNLKNTNGKIIAISDIYETERNRDNGIESVKKNIHNAEIINLID